MSDNIKTISIKNTINNEYEEKFIGVDASRVDYNESTLDVKLEDINSQLENIVNQFDEINIQLENKSNQIENINNNLDEINNNYANKNNATVTFAGDIIITDNESNQISLLDLKKETTTYTTLEDIPVSTLEPNYPEYVDEATVKAKDIQNVLNNKVSINDIYSEHNFPTWSIDSDMSKQVPSLAFLENQIKTYSTEQSYNIQYVVTGPSEAIQIPEGTDVAKYEQYRIVSNNKINSYNPTSEMPVCLAKIITSNNNCVENGNVMKIYYYPKDSVGSYDKIDKFLLNRNLVTTYNSKSKPNTNNIYSADALWQEIQALKMCIAELYNK